MLLNLKKLPVVAPNLLSLFFFFSLALYSCVAAPQSATTSPEKDSLALLDSLTGEHIHPKTLPPPPEKPNKKELPLPAFHSANKTSASSRNSSTSISIKPQQKALPDSLAGPIRIGLKEGMNSFTLKAKGLHSTKGALGSEVRIYIKKGGILLQSAKGEYFFKNSLKLSANGPIEFMKRHYRGQMAIMLFQGKLSLINTLDIEEYLKGVVPHEIGKLGDWGIAALEAQAIAARTYTYKHRGSRQSRGFDLYADTRDQMYLGVEGEYPLSNQAINNTKGIVMTWQNQLIQAYYHSTCGGQTTTPETWGHNALPYLQSVADSSKGKPWGYRSNYTTWERKWTLAELSSIARDFQDSYRPKPSLKFKRIKNLRILQFFSDGRVKSLEVTTDVGKFKVHGDRTRWLFRDPKNPQRILPSSWFTLEKQGKNLILKGQGLGHGIGMCQMGARSRSREGQSSLEILSAYYSGIEFIQFY
jgi:stage II sporulation protein D